MPWVQDVRIRRVVLSDVRFRYIEVVVVEEEQSTRTVTEVADRGEHPLVDGPCI